MNAIETDRLILRTWIDGDADAYYQINQDPKVFEFLPGPLTIEEVGNFISNMNQQFNKIGYTFFAAQEKASGKFMVLLA